MSRRASDGILEIEYGYYPQTAASADLQYRLSRTLGMGFLARTGNTYTTDSRPYDAYNQPFQALVHEECEYDGKRYIRVKANSDYGSNAFTLSNGENYRNGDFVWVEVEPVKWLVDEQEGIAISEKLIFAGVQFNRTRDYKTAN